MNATASFPWRERRAALIVAHPGHELRVHGWLEIAKPPTFVFTDGSGGAGEGRLASTSRVLDAVGAPRGSVYGRFTDRAVYEAVMAGRHELFVALARELADELEKAGIEYVAGDAVEAYNTSHDLCRMTIGAAVSLLARRTGRVLPCYDFLLVGRPDECPPALRDRAILLALDEAALARKRAAAAGYPELAAEVERAVAAVGMEAFRHEVLRPCSLDAGFVPPVAKPYYETYGEKMVAQGRYEHVLRWEEHLRPLAETLRAI